MKNCGLVHIYCGDGKGKTTAAIGLSIRCAGAGGKVCFFQFLKNNSSSEINILKNISGINLIESAENIKFIKNMTEYEKKLFIKFYQKKMEQIIKIISNNSYDMLVLDEIIYAISKCFIDEQYIIDFIKNKPYNTEIIMTGRNPSKNIIKYADYISEIKKIKHPFDKGIHARKMIEF